MGRKCQQIPTSEYEVDGGYVVYSLDECVLMERQRLDHFAGFLLKFEKQTPSPIW